MWFSVVLTCFAIILFLLQLDVLWEYTCVPFIQKYVIRSIIVYYEVEDENAPFAWKDRAAAELLDCGCSSNLDPECFYVGDSHSMGAQNVGGETAEPVGVFLVPLPFGVSYRASNISILAAMHPILLLLGCRPECIEFSQHCHLEILLCLLQLVEQLLKFFIGSRVFYAVLQISYFQLDPVPVHFCFKNRFGFLRITKIKSHVIFSSFLQVRVCRPALLCFLVAVVEWWSVVEQSLI